MQLRLLSEDAHHVLRRFDLGRNVLCLHRVLPGRSRLLWVRLLSLIGRLSQCESGVRVYLRLWTQHRQWHDTDLSAHAADILRQRRPSRLPARLPGHRGAHARFQCCLSAGWYRPHAWELVPRNWLAAIYSRMRRGLGRALRVWRQTERARHGVRKGYGERWEDRRWFLHIWWWSGSNWGATSAPSVALSGRASHVVVIPWLKMLVFFFFSVQDTSCSRKKLPTMTVEAWQSSTSKQTCHKI